MPLLFVLGIGLVGIAVPLVLAAEPKAGTFVGTLEGRREITLRAGKHYSTMVVDGIELESESAKILLIQGGQNDDGEWVLTEFPDAERTGGTIRGKAGLKAFEGTWTGREGRASTPIRLRRLPDDESVAVAKEIDRNAEGFAERAVEAAVAGDSRRALFYLRLYRVSSRWAPYDDHWEALFEAKVNGTGEAFYQRARSIPPSERDYAGLQDPLAYLLAERGEIAEAKRIYQSQCRRHPYSQSPLPFTCLMSASLSEKAGDRAGMWEGYDYACDYLPFACRKAFGPAEQRLMDAAERGDSAAALKELQQPGLNVDARHGKALDQAVLHGMKELFQALLAYGANPNADSRIMEEAILNHRPEMPGLLLEHGLDPNLGMFLFHAVDQGNLALAEALIRKGAKVNEDDFVGGGTALMAATENNNRAMVKLLLENGADPTIAAKFHDAPLQSAKDPEIRRMLRNALNECKAGTRKCEKQP